MIIETEKDYKKANTKIKRLAKKKDTLKFPQLQDAMDLIDAVQQYEKQNPKKKAK